MRSKAEFEKYNADVNAITDVNKLQKNFNENAELIRQKSKMPVLASVGGGWGALALLLLTGFMSGWTLGVLWFVATIAGAGIIASAVAGFVGYLKYRKYFRAVRTQKRLEKLLHDNQNYDDRLRMRLEKRMNKDLAYCRKKRMISDRELYARSHFMEVPQVDGRVAERSQEEIADEAERYNSTMENMQADVTTRHSALEPTLENRQDNFNQGCHSVQKIVIKSNKFDERGNIVLDETNRAVEYRVEFNSISEKETALYMSAISQVFKEKIASSSLPFPIVVEICGADGQPINMAVGGAQELGARFVFDYRDIVQLTSDSNPLDNFANSIVERLPVDESQATAQAQTSEGVNGAEAGTGATYDGTGAEHDGASAVR